MNLKPNHQICPSCNGHSSENPHDLEEAIDLVCPPCNNSGQIPITLTPGIYGQIGVPPIVMAWNSNYEKTKAGPFYLLSYSAMVKGSVYVWTQGKIGLYVKPYRHCRLATPEECEGIEPWADIAANGGGK